jgi:thiol-disulfide isomerase/thioredoxin
LAADPIPGIRGKLAAGDLHSAEAIAEDYRRAEGETKLYWRAASWLARGYAQHQHWAQAEKWGQLTVEGSLRLLNGKPLDQEEDLEIALGAGYEALAKSYAATGRRAQAVQLLETQIEKWKGSPLEKRLRKNWNGLQLTGRAAPAIEGVQPKSALLFFWAHYCGDCTAQAPIVREIAQRFATRGLKLIAPTQRYGLKPTVAEEDALIEQRWREYGFPADAARPVSEAAMRIYGVSSTPTIVLVDGRGLVRMYSPTRLTAEKLSAAISQMLGTP